MYRTASKFILALLVAPFSSAAAQQPAVTGPITSSEIAISRERAEIKLEMDDGRKLTFATAAGGAPGIQRIGNPGGDETIVLGVQRGDAVDRSWRELLNKAMDTDAGALSALLANWESTDKDGRIFDLSLESALGQLVPAAP